MAFWYNACKMIKFRLVPIVYSSWLLVRLYVVRLILVGIFDGREQQLWSTKSYRKRSLHQTAFGTSMGSDHTHFHSWYVSTSKRDHITSGGVMPRRCGLFLAPMETTTLVVGRNEWMNNSLENSIEIEFGYVPYIVTHAQLTVSKNDERLWKRVNRQRQKEIVYIGFIAMILVYRFLRGRISRCQRSGGKSRWRCVKWN